MLFARKFLLLALLTLATPTMAQITAQPSGSLGTPVEAATPTANTNVTPAAPVATATETTTEDKKAEDKKEDAATAALPQTIPAQSSGLKHPVLQAFTKEGGKIQSLGSAYGLDGYFLTNSKGGEQFVYLTPQDGFLVGMLFAPDGTPETTRQIQANNIQLRDDKATNPTTVTEKKSDAVVTAKTPETAETSNKTATSGKADLLYAAAEKAAYVSVGASTAPVMYVFLNVNCEHCQGLWQDLQTGIAEQRIQLRLIPFGSVDANREGGAALLSVNNPAAAFTAYIKGDKEALGKDKIKTGMLDKLDANTALVKEWKLQGPPFSMYRRPSDNVITAVVGRPDNVLILLADLLQ